MNLDFSVDAASRLSELHGRLGAFCAELALLVAEDVREGMQGTVLIDTEALHDTMEEMPELEVTDDTQTAYTVFTAPSAVEHKLRKNLRPPAIDYSYAGFLWEGARGRTPNLFPEAGADLAMQRLGMRVAKAAALLELP